MQPLVACALVLLCACSAIEQTPADAMQSARAKVEAKEWHAALEQLLPLQDEVESAAALDSLGTMLQTVGDALSADEDYEQALRARLAALAVLERACGNRDHASVARSLFDLADCLALLGRLDEALPRFRAALAMQQRLHGDEGGEDVARTMNALASCLKFLGQPTEALPHYEAALAMRQRLHGGRDHPDIASSLNNHAHCLLALGRTSDALPQLRAALEMTQRIHGESDHPDLARSLGNLAFCLQQLGRAGDALPLFEASLAMRVRINGDKDHPDVAGSLGNHSLCLRLLGQVSEALTRAEAALAMTQRLSGDRDHPTVVWNLDNVAGCRQQLGDAAGALPMFEAAFAMTQRLYGEGDHATLASAHNNLASCLSSLGRMDEALRHYEASMAMLSRLHGGSDHPDVASSLASTAFGLSALGRNDEALPLHEAALAMRRRLFDNGDHPQVAESLNNIAHCLQALGRVGEALPQHEAALAMRQRLFVGRDHPRVAESLDSVGFCLEALGRPGDALPQFEAALAMKRRLYADRDHPSVASSLNNFAFCLQSLGRASEALPQLEAALAMNERLSGDRDHPDVALGLNNVAGCLLSLGQVGDALAKCKQALEVRQRLHGNRDHTEVAESLTNFAECLRLHGRSGEALPQFEAALAMWQRLHAGRDHPLVAAGLRNVAACRQALGQAGDALPKCEAALAMLQRLYGDRDHPELAKGLAHVAYCLSALSRGSDALPWLEQSAAMIERLRGSTRTSAELRQALFEDLKQGNVFETIQRLARELGRAPDAFYAAERSRGRDLLDALEQLGDPEAEAQHRARLRGDEAAAARLASLCTEIETARTESDRLLHELTKLANLADDAERDKRRAELRAESNAVSGRLRPLLDERARLLGEVLPVGHVRTAAEIQGSLRDGELLLEFTLTAKAALLYVVARDREVEVVDLPDALATTQRVVPQLLQQASRAPLRGRDPKGRPHAAAAHEASRQLFLSLFPAPVWERIRTSQRVFVAAHRELHRVPLEMLVTDIVDGKPVHWLDRGPPIGYVPSGSVLHWLRHRAVATGADATSLDLLAIGDPRQLDAARLVPENGVFVATVNDGGEGARVGLQPGDVLTSYDGKPLADDKALRDTRLATERAVADGQRNGTPIPVVVWRNGEQRLVEVRPGALGIQVGSGRARSAWERTLSGAAQLERIARSSDLERIRQLPPLRGARAEAEAIAAAFRSRQGSAQHLLGAEATEPAVFELAAKARYLHFACHGIAEEYAGQSLSMLVLSQPQQVLPGDDGLLKLGDLWHSWRGRLASCRLVVLSACQTNVGPTGRDEAPHALPLGFLFAGAPAVISSLWPVDDASTQELMTDFYGRLLAGETDRLAAFTAAKRALRARHPDPFHWAPFLYLGAPD